VAEPEKAEESSVAVVRDFAEIDAHLTAAAEPGPAADPEAPDPAEAEAG
jgi:hypothetical protein